MRFLLGILGLGMIASATATEANWVNTQDPLAYWAQPANWQGVEEIPTNGEDVALAPLASGVTAQTVSTGGVPDSGDRSLVVNDVVVGKLTGDAAHTVEHATRVSSYSKPYARTFTIDDASDFWGLLKVGQPLAAFCFPSSTSVARLSARNRVIVNVPNDGTTLTVGALEEGGAIEKTGAGALVLSSVADKATLVYAKAGTLTLGDGVGTVKIADEFVSVGVSAETRATVRNVVVGGSKLVKTGEGTLVIDRMTPETASVEVRGGAVAFERTLDVDEPAAAENPSLWLDASKLATMDPQPVDAGDAVQAWKDCRADVDRVASNGWQQASTLAAHSPTLVKDAAGTGLHALSLGTDANDVSWIRTQWWRDDEWSGAPNACAGFIVYRPTTDGSVYYKNILGSSTLDMFRNDGWKTIVCPNYAESAAAGSLWTMDGAVVDPWDNTVKPASECGRFRVMAFSSPIKLYCNGIAKVHGSADSSAYAGANFCGGIQVCEFIIYDRPLSEDERVRTEAYLMKKWLNRDHPAATTRSSASLAFGAAVAPVVESATDMSVTFTGGNGAFVKKGDGAVALDAASAANISSLAVLGGSLSLPVAGVDDEIAFHFDASDAASLTTQLEEKAGKMLTNVTVWADTRANGLTATSQLMNTGTGGEPKAYPTLVSYEMVPGTFRTMIDFGSLWSADRGGMNMSQSFTDVKDVMIVFADQDNGGYHQQRLFTDLTGTDFYRKNGMLLDTDNAKKGYQDGYISVDRVTVGRDHDLEYGRAHVISMAPLAGTTGRINSIANDRNGTAGGCLIGEQIAFKKNLSLARREYWEKYLMWKWFGDGVKPVWADATYSSVELDNGAALALDGTGAQVVTAKLAGWGAMTADDVTIGENGEFAVTVSPASLASGAPVLAVNGRLSFGSGVRVTLNVSGKLPVGVHPLVAADELGEIDLDSVQVIGETKQNFKLIRRGNEILLSVQAPGLLLILR